MHEADDGRGARVGELQRCSARPEPQQRVIDHAVLREHQQPAVGAHHIGGPEGQDGEHQRQPLQARRHQLGQNPGEGVGEQHGDDRDRQRHLQRIDQGAPVARIVEELAVVFQRQPPPPPCSSRLSTAMAMKGSTKKTSVQASAGVTSAQGRSRPGVVAFTRLVYCACSISVQTSCIFLSRSASGAG